MPNPTPLPCANTNRPPELPLPPLTDEAAIGILDFLHIPLAAFENRCSPLLRRYYRSRHNLIELDHNRASEDPPV